jgi:uncharacterized HAD superfamily protein
MMEERVLAVDADEVLWGNLPCFLEYIKRTYQISHMSDRFLSYKWWETITEWTPAQLQQRYEEFHDCGASYEMVPFEDALPSLQVIRNELRFKPRVVTSRLRRFEVETRTMISRHYPSIFDDVHFGSHHSQNGAERKTKVEMCLEIGATILIEDDLGHAIPCAKAGMTVLLFGDYGWNRVIPPGYSNIIRVRNWSEVAQVLPTL